MNGNRFRSSREALRGGAEAVITAGTGRFARIENPVTFRSYPHPVLNKVRDAPRET